jgi:hypothetical protein
MNHPPKSTPACRSIPLFPRWMSGAVDDMASLIASLAAEWLARVSVREGRRLRHRFWQPGGGYDRNITSTEALRAVIDDIHANPVRRGLVARAERLGMVQRALVRGTAAGEAGNGPGRACGAGKGIRWLRLPHALRSTSGRATPPPPPLQPPRLRFGLVCRAPPADSIDTQTPPAAVITPDGT